MKRNLPRFLLVMALFCALAGCGRKTDDAPAVEKQDESNVFAGRVADSEDLPVADAEVLAYTLKTDFARAGPMTLEIVGTSRTGEDGTFQFTKPDPDDSRVMFSVAARKPGYAIGWTAARPLGAEDKEGGNVITLRAPADVAGTVVDEKGSAVTGVDVLAFLGFEEENGRPDYLMVQEPLTWTRTETDDEGRFRLSVAPEGGTVAFLVHAPGRARLCTIEEYPNMFPYRSGETNITLELPPEAQIEGAVVGGTKDGDVAGRHIMVNEDASSHPFQSRLTQTDEEGTFSVDGLEAGTYRLRLVRPDPDEPADWVAEPVPITVASGETATGAVLRLQKGGMLEVQVTAEQDGEPVEGATLYFTGEDRSTPVQFKTEEDGRARRRVLPGEYRLHGVYHSDYRRTGERGETVVVEEGETTGLEFSLEPTPQLAGVVRDPAGAPVEGVTLRILPWSRAETTSDENGQFELKWDPSAFGGGMEEPVSYLLATHRDRNLAGAVELEEGTETLEVELGPGAVFAGRVLDLDGEPIPDATVSVILKSGYWSSPVDREAAATDEEGVYRVTGLAADLIYRVRAEAEGFGPDSIEAACLEPSTNPVEVADIVLKRADLSVAGTVIDEDEKPIAGVEIHVSGNGQPSRRTKSDAEGKFTIEGICAGRVHLFAQPRGDRAHGSASAEAGARDVQIVLGESSSFNEPVAPELPPSLVGRPLPAATGLGIDSGLEPVPGKPALVCFWDMDQRPSRHCVYQLARQGERLAELGVQVILVHARSVDQARIDAWTEKQQVPFPSGVIGTEKDKTWQIWGVRGLPWLVLADTQRVARAQGFSVSSLEDELAVLAAE